MIRQSQLSSLTLVVTDDFKTTQTLRLKPDHSIFLGTSANCELVLTGTGVAQMHCYLKSEEGRLWVQDWMSKTGTLVNGVAITAPTEVNPGDVIEVGPNRIVCQGDTVASSPADAATSGPALSREATTVGAADQEGNQADDFRQSSRCVADALEPMADSEVAASDPWTEAAGGFSGDYFEVGDDDSYDAETVALLRAEIEDLRAAVAASDAGNAVLQPQHSLSLDTAEETDGVLARMQELIEEANRSDERVALLEEMLHAAEDANRAEQEERAHLEAWVTDIEKRIGQREDEHQAEIAALQQRLEESHQAQQRLAEQLRQAADNGGAARQYEDHLRDLQVRYEATQDELAQARQRCASLQQRLEQASGEQERALCEERAKIAKEHAKLARMRFEVTSKLAEFEEAPLPKNENRLDLEAAHRIQALREHLREIHEQERHEEKSETLTSRLARLWQRVEY